MENELSIVANEVILTKGALNSLIHVLLIKSGLSFQDVNQFILSHYDELSSAYIPIRSEKPIDTSELFTSLFGKNSASFQQLTSEKFKKIFTNWYQTIYTTQIGGIVKTTLSSYQTDDIDRITLSIIEEFETFIDSRKNADRIEIITGQGATMNGRLLGGGRPNMVTIVLLMISCLCVFAPSGKFIEKSKVQQLANQRISSVVTRYQISDTLLTKPLVDYLQNDLFKDITSNTGVEIIDYVKYWQIDDKYVTDIMKNTKTTLHSFGDIIGMISSYIVDTNHGKNGEGLMSTFLMPSLLSMVDMDSIIQLNESIKKTTKDINKMITLATTITDTVEVIKRVANPTIKVSVETFLRLLEPKITERYDSSYTLMGGKPRKTMRRKKRIGRKRRYHKTIRTIRH